MKRLLLAALLAVVSTTAFAKDPFRTYPELIDFNDDQTGVRLLQIKLFSPYSRYQTRINHLGFTCQENRVPTVEFTTYPNGLHGLSAPNNSVSFRFDMSDPWPPEVWDFQILPEMVATSGLRSENWNLFNRILETDLIKISVTRRYHKNLHLHAKYARPLLKEFQKRCRSYSVKSEAELVPPTPREKYDAASEGCEQKYPDKRGDCVGECERRYLFYPDKQATCRDECDEKYPDKERECIDECSDKYPMHSPMHSDDLRSCWRECSDKHPDIRRKKLDECIAPVDEEYDRQKMVIHRAKEALEEYRAKTKVPRR